jgi:aspartyl/asparaginyl beta-hydroxylase (cupin superfamily)
MNDRLLWTRTKIFTFGNLNPITMISINPHVAFRWTKMFDIHLLENDLAIALEQNWHNHYNSSDYSGDWKIIALRSENGNESTITAKDSHHYQDTELLSHCWYFKQILDGFLCEKQAVRLMQLAPQSKIKTHRDYNLGYEDGVFRVHVPIQTNNDVSFIVDNHHIPMKEGECWYANFNLPHSVENMGQLPRIHLVIDCIRNAWSDEMFAASGFDLSKTDKNAIRNEDIPKIISQLEMMDTDAARVIIEELRAKL